MKKLKSLKQQYKQEEQAFSKIRKIHRHLAGFSDVKILAYFELPSGEALIDYVTQLQKSGLLDDEEGVGVNHLCTCTDENGIGKELYETKSEAQSMCALRNREAEVSLSVYACPVTRGWHLTKG